MKNGKVNGKAKSKKKTIKVNFEGVEARVLLPEGQYHGRVEEITLEDGNAAQYLKWVFAVVDEDPKFNGKKLFYNTSLAPQALWNLRNLLETLGVEVPSSETDLDTDEFIGLELMLRVEHETYEGKDRAKVTDFTPLEEQAEVENDEEEETEEEDEEEEADEEEEDESGKLSADEVKELGKDEILDLIKTHKLKIPEDIIKKPGKRLAAVLDQLEAKGLLSA